MFYSHESKYHIVVLNLPSLTILEVLTSREGGIATVWLVATLGSKSNNKKINRKSILEVDVPKACNIIIQPDAPMALRLQGNLLYGVARVFSRQYEYVVSDAQAIQTNIRTLLKAVKTSDLDPNAGKTHRDQLMIHDDPAFLPDLTLPGLDIDLSALDISTDESSRRSSILSPHSLQSSLSSSHVPDDSMIGLVIPSSTSGGAGSIGGFQLPAGNFSLASGSSSVGLLPDDDDDRVLNFDPGFTVDGDGNLVETLLQSEGSNRLGALGPESMASVGTRQGPGIGLETGRFESDRDMMNLDLDLDLNLANADNNDPLLPGDAQPFPAMTPAADGRIGRLRSSSEALQEHESSDSAGAPLQRKKRIAKELPVDQRQELHNADLEDWKNDYLANMSAASSTRIANKTMALARKNAAHWVIDSGIGGIGAGIGSARIKSPFDVFAGPAFLESLTGVRWAEIGKKRTSRGEEDDAANSDVRAVRIRLEDGEQFGRGDDHGIQGDGTSMGLIGEGIEIGRHAQPPLEDPSMPWNSMASSHHGSLSRAQGFQSSLGGFPSSAGGQPGSFPSIGGPGSHERRVSRVASASPLVGRGQHRYSSLELPMGDDGNIGFNDDGQDVSDLQVFEDFELYGPGATVNTQIAADSQWVRNALTQEASNFLAFVKAETESRAPPLHDDDDELLGEVQTSITFDELLPPDRHSKLVGAQGFHHVLMLATAGQLDVNQVNTNEMEGFGPIKLAIPGANTARN